MTIKYIRQTFSTFYSRNKNVIKIFDFMTTESKNIYNHYLYCYNIFKIYKKEIFNEIIKLQNDENINENIILILEKYYKFHNEHKNNYNANNNFIFNYIIKKNIIIDNANLNNIYDQIKIELINDGNLNYESNKKALFDDIIYNICHSFYKKNYFDVKNSILYKKPYKKNYSDEFINHVRVENMITNNNTSFDTLKHKFKDIKSQQNIIRRFAYKLLVNKGLKLSSDLTINIMDKVYDNIKSYYTLVKNGRNAKFPKFIKDKYVLPFLGGSSFSIQNNKIRLTLGKYIKNNIIDIINNKNYICNKGEYYHVENKNLKFECQFINLKLCKKLRDINIKTVEIVPTRTNKYKICYTYDKKIIIDENNLNGQIGIDLGEKNLITIYDPNGEQYIIKGGNIIGINSYFSKKIARLQSEIDVSTDTNINKHKQKLINLYWHKRDNKINTIFNNIVMKISLLYPNKKEIIVGYNEGWKQNVNMGHKNNDKFYKIPYKNLINKLRNKIEQYGTKLIEVNESYTSKCDALKLEPIKKHEVYSGSRIKRGLYKSYNGKYINADLNGAINILRKYNELEQITGKNIYNPKTIKIESPKKRISICDDIINEDVNEEISYYKRIVITRKILKNNHNDIQ